MKTSHLFVATSFLALTIFGGASKAQAMTPYGDKFCHDGIPQMDTFIARFEKAVVADPTGGSVKIEGCRAVPMHFVQAILAGNPKASVNGQPLTVSNFGAYLRKLVPATIEKDAQYESSCIWATDQGDTVKLHCHTRDLFTGEKVLKDPDTGVLVMLTGCANPDVVVVPPIVVTGERCLQVRYPPLLQGIPVRVAYIGPAPLPGSCYELDLSGESQPRYDFPQECSTHYEATLTDGRIVTIDCDWRRDEIRVSRYLTGKAHKQVVAKAQNVTFNYKARTSDGTDVVFLPLQAKNGVVAICWTMPDGTVLTVGVTAEDYVKGIATVTPQQAVTIGAIH